MRVWVCPNAKCAYDKELQPGRNCPLCGEQAEEFSLGEVDGLLKRKWDFKRSLDRARRQEVLLEKTKFCPKCGSANVNFLVFYRPSIWRCLDCGYEGAFMVEDSGLAEKLREQYRKKKP